MRFDEISGRTNTLSWDTGIHGPSKKTQRDWKDEDHQKGNCRDTFFMRLWKSSAAKEQGIVRRRCLNDALPVGTAGTWNACFDHHYSVESEASSFSGLGKWLILQKILFDDHLISTNSTIRSLSKIYSPQETKQGQISESINEYHRKIDPATQQHTSISSAHYTYAYPEQHIFGEQHAIVWPRAWIDISSLSGCRVPYSR